MIAYVIVAALLVALVGLALSVRILKQYERAVMFHLGKVRDGTRGPGLIFFTPLVNQVHRVSLRIELFSSALPADALYDESSLPRIRRPRVTRSLQTHASKDR